jgi:hypothetical protein
MFLSVGDVKITFLKTLTAHKKHLFRILQTLSGDILEFTSWEELCHNAVTQLQRPAWLLLDHIGSYSSFSDDDMTFIFFHC